MDFQRRQQLVRIILDRRHAVAREQLGKKPQHDLAVFQHVGDAGRRARIVLEHVEVVGVDAHDIDAGDMDINVVRHLLPVHLRAENRILKHQILGDDPGLENLAAAIDVLDVGVDGLDALLQPALQNLPLGGREDARNDVEGDETLLRLGVAVDCKGDADTPEEVLGFTAAEIEHVGRNLAEPLRQLGVGGPHRAFAAAHLVEHIGPRSTQVVLEKCLPHQWRSLKCSNLCANLDRRGRGTAFLRPAIAHVLGGLTSAAGATSVVAGSGYKS